MPLYEYECDSCGHRFERIQKFSDPAITACPVCGGQVRKLLSSPAIQFKGSGFYITDYAKAGKASDSGGAEKPAGADSGTAEKPAGADSASKTDTAAGSSKAEAGASDAAKSAETKKPDSPASKGEKKT
jgi:putative FmdB family regulatory protein